MKEDEKDFDGILEFYFKVIKTEGIDEISKLNIMKRISIIYLEEKENIGEALKYALIASAFTFSPRADLCCLLGDIYKKFENEKWATFWYESAIGNIPQITETNGLKKECYTTLPLLKLSVLNFENGDYEKANEYNEAVLKMEPENEDALHNREKIKEKIG